MRAESMAGFMAEALRLRGAKRAGERASERVRDLDANAHMSVRRPHKVEQRTVDLRSKERGSKMVAKRSRAVQET